MSLLRPGSLFLKYKWYGLILSNNEFTSVPLCKTRYHKIIRTYRDISHGPPPVARGTKCFYVFIFFLFICCVYDIKTILGLRDKRKELEELIHYNIPDEVVTYSEKPGFSDKNT